MAAGELEAAANMILSYIWTADANLIVRKQTHYFLTSFRVRCRNWDPTTVSSKRSERSSTNSVGVTPQHDALTSHLQR